MFQEVLKTYNELKEVLKEKKQAIIHKELEKLHQTDEEIKVICEKLEKFDLKNSSDKFNQGQKEQLRNLGQEIKEIQQNNEILIKHSLNVINEVLSGILNITMNENSSYDSRGLAHRDKESFNISSITEEA